MTTTPVTTIEPGQYVKLGPYVGRVMDVLKSNDKTVLRIYFVKNAFQRNLPEYQEIDGTHELSIATPQEVKAEIGRYMRMLRENLQENFQDVME